MKQHLWGLLAAAGLGLAAAPGARAQTFSAGNLVVSRSTYQDVGQAAGLTVGSNLPDSNGPNKSGVTTPFQANATGAYPTVFNNNQVDGSFGVTSAIFLDNVTTGGKVVGTLAVDPNQIVTSFSSKSELAVNFSTDGSAVTFMGYGAPLGALDVSNSNTPGVIEPGNYVTAAPTYREVAQVNAAGTVQVTTTNAYDGNNGRAAILDSKDGEYLTVGNAGNGNGSAATTAATGVQIVTPGLNATPSAPGTTKVGSFNVTQVGLPADKTAKDDNYRGETVFNNTLYVTKGSGSNGIDTVYQVGAGGALPTAANAAAAPINVLPGFPTGSAKTNAANFYPFGIWFANQTTLYVADEGDGVIADAATDGNAGLEKWSLNTGTGVWGLDYTLQTGLSLGTAYTVAGYPTGINPVTGLPYAPATDGLRNITGTVNANGTVSIFGVTSTVSGSGDQGADPNELVSITDLVSDTTAAQAATEQFTTLEGPVSGNVYRGVAFDTAAVPEPSAPALLALPLAGLCLLARRRKAA